MPGAVAHAARGLEEDYLQLEEELQLEEDLQLKEDLRMPRGAWAATPLHIARVRDPRSPETLRPAPYTLYPTHYIPHALHTKKTEHHTLYPTPYTPYTMH